jgi:hypothetical protein
MAPPARELVQCSPETSVGRSQGVVTVNTEAEDTGEASM